MKRFIKRALAGVLISISLINSVPMQVFALDRHTHKGEFLNSNHFNNFKDDLESITSISGVNGFENNAIGNTHTVTSPGNDYSILTDLSNNCSISELEEGLLTIGGLEVPKNGIIVYKDYADGNSKKGKVLLVQISVGNGTFNIGSTDKDHEKSLKNIAGSQSSKINNTLAYIYLDESDNDEAKIALRLIGWKKPTFSGIIDDEDPMPIFLEYDLTPILKNLSNTKQDELDKYSYSKYLIEQYNNYKKQKLEGLKKEQKAIFDDYDKNGNAPYADWQNKSFLVSLNKYVVGDEYNAPDVPGIILGSHNIITTLLYTDALKISNIFERKDYSKYDTVNGTNRDGNIQSDNNFSGKNLVETVQNANNIADKYAKTSGSVYNTKGVESNAGLFGDLTKYRFGKLVNAPERPIGSVASDQRQVESKLEDLLVDSTELTNRLINPKLWSQAYSINWPIVDFSYKEALNVMTSTQMLEYYAKDSSLSGIADDNDTLHNKDLEDILAANATKSKDELPTLESKPARWVKTYRQIKEGLDFLGVKPWTKELEYIYNTSDKFNDYPNSEELDNYDEEDDYQPLKRFFDYDNGVMSNHYLTGVALSATYIPMQTNLYDPTSIRVLKEKEWLSDFHIKYGFYRKALMIDVNVNAAVDNYITDGRDSVRPAILKDLLEYSKDIVLYVDDNFYNTDEVAEMTDKVYNRLSNSEQAGLANQTMGGWLENLFNDSIENILKTGPEQKYDASTIEDTTEYGKQPGWFNFSGFWEKMFTDGIILSGGDGPGDTNHNDIKKGLDQSDYDVKQSYAVVSGIYRDKDLAQHLNVIAANPKPVFVSSPALHSVEGISEYEFNSIYNYYMLRNLEDSIGVDYKTTLDLDSPIYTDIYGNIVTESGLVVIPAASNATLYPKSSYSTYTIGFMDLYSNGDNIKGYKNENIKNMLTDFTYDGESDTWLQNNYEFNGIPVNPQRPSVADKELLEVLYDNQISMLNNKSYDIDQRIWLTTEVMRGAPLENIDKEKEGITGKRDVNKYGLYMSWKLDEIADALLPTSNGNSIISMPNLAFMDGIEYVVLFAFKAMLLLFVTYIMYMVYLDAIGGKLGLKTLWTCVSTIVIFSLCIAVTPRVISLSYNEPNKIFLQDEIKYVNLLNYEKDLEGREISAVGVEEPKSQTKLYLKVDSINVPWYKVLQDVMFAPIGTTLSKLYEEELSDNILYGYEDIQVVNDGVYIDIDDLFDSSSIIYNNNLKFLYQNVNHTPTASYFIPYYYLIDNALAGINVYNKENGILNITTKIQSDGSVRTMGMIGDYLLSEWFLLDAPDPLGLYDLYGIDTNQKTEFITKEVESYSDTKQSMWYVRDNYEAEEIASRIDQLYSYMRAYVAQNREMIGRVTDETFIKAMMLDVSMEYNRIFRIPAAKGIEVFNIDSRDLMRLSITDKNTSVVNSSLSFGKFVYEQAGGLGVILTAILLAVYFVTSVVKPALVIFLCGLLVYNLLIRNMFKMDKGKTVEGLLYVLSIMVIVNSVYALFIKLSMMLPNLGMNPVISIIGQIAIQILYLVLITKVVGAIIKDIANFGFNVFQTGALAIAGFATGAAMKVHDKFSYSDEQRSYMESAKMKNESKTTTESEDLREEMERRDKKREEAEEGDAFMDVVFSNKYNNSNSDKEDKE